MITFRTQYSDYNPLDYSFQTEGESLTQEQFQEECDINIILSKYQNTGFLNHVMKTEGNFGDFTSIEDYQTSLNKIMTAQENFNLLPSELRSKFDNDPGKLIGFIQEPTNKEDCIKYGLIIENKQEPTIQQQFETALQNHDDRRLKTKS